MKKLIPFLTLLAAGLLAAPAGIRAEDKPAGRGAGAAAERLKAMTETLGLTQEQQDKVKAIYEKNAPQLKELMAKGRENLTAEDRTKLGELLKAQMDQVSAILTPEQQEKFKAMRAEGAGKRGERKPGEKKPESK